MLPLLLKPPCLIHSTAAVFSISLLVLGAAFGWSFSALNLRRAVNGFGTSGIVTSELSFSVPRSSYYEIELIKAAPVKFAITDNETERTIESPNFYVNSRSVSKGIISFVCYDRMAFADSISFSEDEFNFDTINAPFLVQMCAEKLELNGVEYHGGDFTVFTKYPVYYAEGKSVAQVLTDLSVLLAGVFYITNDNKLGFCAFGNYPHSVSFDKHTSTDIGCTTHIDGVVMTDSSGNYYTSGTDSGFTVTASSPLASQAAADAVGRRIIGHEFTSMSCDKVLLFGLPEVNALASFADCPAKFFYLNSIDLTISGFGIYGSFKSNTAGGGEIGEYMSRQNRLLAQAIKANSIIGNNFMLTPYQGAIFVAPEKKSTTFSSRDNSGKDEEENRFYGFEVKEGGMTYYDGVMSSQKTVTSISVDKDAGTVTCIFEDGHIYEYHADVTETETGFDISDEGDEWT